MKCECGEEIESIAHLKGHRQYCEKPLVPTKSEVQQLHDDLAAALLQIDGLKKERSDFQNRAINLDIELTAANRLVDSMKNFISGLVYARVLDERRKVEAEAFIGATPICECGHDKTIHVNHEEGCMAGPCHGPDRCRCQKFALKWNPVTPGFCRCLCHRTQKVTGEASGCGCCSYNA